MRRIWIIIISVIVTQLVMAQTVAEAEALFNSEQYAEAVAMYETLLVQHPNDATIHLKMGRSYLMVNEPAKAIPHFEFARRKKLMRGERYLGDSYLLVYRFDDAINAYENYLKHFSKNDDAELARESMVRAELGKHMLERIEDVAIIDSFHVNANEFLQAYHLNRELGEVMPLAQLFGRSVTPEKYAYMSGRQDRIIYPKEGASGKDLMISYRLGDNWTTATPLQGGVNSDADENYPFMMPDGIMLYFASKGHNSLGGYDIFLSRYNSESDSYSTPQNVGMPFNSPFNDYLLVIDELAQVGWFVTDRYQPKDQVVVYEFAPNNKKVILDITDKDSAIARASLKEIHWTENPKMKLVNLYGNKQIEPTDSIYFIVNDHLIYHSLKEFKSDEARKLYEESVNKRTRMKTLYVLLDGKRRELFLTDDDQDKAIISADIVALEEEINEFQRLHQDYMLQSRRAEIMELNKAP